VCFFLCLGVPKKAASVLETVSHAFDTRDVTEWSIGKAVCGSTDRDRSFLITSGGCSCFVTGGNHGSGESKLQAFESLMKLLLKQARYVSMLVHDTRGDIAGATVMCKYKSRVSLHEIISNIERLQTDVRYILTD